MTALAYQPSLACPMTNPEQTLRAIVADAVKQECLFASANEIISHSHHHNSDQHQYSVQTAAGAFFIKCREASYLSHFEAEQAGLFALINTQTLATCAPLAVGTVDGYSYILLQHLPLSVHGDWFSAGQQLAQLHGHTSDKGYGFAEPTYCGETEQNNQWNSDWADFFVDQRLEFLLAKLVKCGVRFDDADKAMAAARQLLSNHHPEASLLHGDLWSGNIGFNPDKQLSYPIIYDPASYYGDGETDLAMTELFGRFPKRFYEGYATVRPIDEGYSLRCHVYQLYHVLNHALLFGGSYIPQAKELMQTIMQSASDK